MKRTTVMLPDDVDARLRREARRRGVSVAEVVRQAVERHVPAPESGRALTFFALGEGRVDGGERAEEYVAEIVRRRHDSR